jgi:hypothetical protein
MCLGFKQRAGAGGRAAGCAGAGRGAHISPRAAAPLRRRAGFERECRQVSNG